MEFVIPQTPLAERLGTLSATTGTRSVDSNTNSPRKTGVKLPGAEYSNTRDEKEFWSRKMINDRRVYYKMDHEKRIKMNNIGLHFCRRYRNLVRYDPNFCKTCSFFGKWLFNCPWYSSHDHCFIKRKCNSVRSWSSC